MIEKEISDIVKGQDKVDLYLAIIDALSKQLPYKPKPYRNFAGMCRCGVIFLDKTTRYCGNCGQKLNWEGCTDG